MRRQMLAGPIRLTHRVRVGKCNCNCNHNRILRRSMAAMPTNGKENNRSKYEPSFYDSCGDYGIDALQLEDPSLPLYHLQAQLPTLPVPSLQHSLQLILQSSLPLASSTEESESLKRAVDKFPLQAKILQERLEQRAKVKSQASSTTPGSGICNGGYRIL